MRWLSSLHEIQGIESAAWLYEGTWWPLEGCMAVYKGQDGSLKGHMAL